MIVLVAVVVVDVFEWVAGEEVDDDPFDTSELLFVGEDVPAVDESFM